MHAVQIPRTRTRPPRSANLVLDPPVEEIGAKVDWSSWYLTDEEDMGQSPRHGIEVDDFDSSLKVLRAERGWTGTMVGMDAFFAWVQAEPLVRVSPDVYLLDDPPDPLPDSFELWKTGIRPPRFALEVISKRPERVHKDLVQNPPKYAQLGAAELVVFDPAAVKMVRSKKRVPLVIFRRTEDGAFLRVYSGRATTPIWSAELEAWLVIRTEGGIPKLRIVRDREGADVVPTEGELAVQQTQRAKQEAQRAEQQAQRAEQQAQRAGQEALRAEQEAQRANQAELRALALEKELEALKEALRRP
ncbi:MAG: Uma2 family endonuclease [Deltaproteobacteria bacterium]|nr:Uma2 family endonuclease [Deltaproteobacteria bacterium]